MSSIEEILSQIDDLVERSHPIPFVSHRAIIDADKLRELLNQAHLSIPAEIKRAKMIDADCERISREANEKAEQIIQDAEAHAGQLVSEQMILQEAKRQALDELSDAQTKAKEIRAAAARYVQNVLSEVEVSLQEAIDEVYTTKKRVESVRNE